MCFFFFFFWGGGLKSENALCLLVLQFENIFIKIQKLKKNQKTTKQKNKKTKKQTTTKNVSDIIIAALRSKEVQFSNLQIAMIFVMEVLHRGSFKTSCLLYNIEVCYLK